MPIIQCLECGKDVEVIPARVKTAKFCSLACRGKWRSKNFVGEKNPNFRGGYNKPCAHCGTEFWVIPATQHRKFCSKPCADIGGFRYSGADHPNYREGARRRNRGGAHASWVDAVMRRDKETCQHCGATGVEMHAHHLLSFRDHPELREVVSNGVTLCYSCHWKVHSAQNEKAVNSVNTRPAEGSAEGNTEPSFHGNVVEGVTTRGRAYRRWTGVCEWCGTFLSKTLSDATGRAHNFCSRHCSGKYNSAHRSYRPWANPDQPMAVISSTSAAPEREEIV